MKRYLASPVFLLALAVLICAISYAFNLPVMGDPLHGPLLLGMAGAAPALDRPTLAWGRLREPMKPFYNVGVSQIATAIIPKYSRTVLGFFLQLGGTTFAKSDISRIELFVGETSIWGPVSGTELNNIVKYSEGMRYQDDYMLPLDFTLPDDKELAGEQIGGLNLMTLPDGVIRLEVEIGAGAVAPTLSGHVVWSPPQGNGPFAGLMMKLKKRVYAQLPAGDNYPLVDLRGALLLRQFFMYTVQPAGVSAVAGAGVAFVNVGNGVMGAITVAQGTPAGRYRLRVLGTVAAAGKFAVYDPLGREVGAGNVGTAFSGGGLGFTLADGAVDFLSGDGFTIDVLPMNADGNLSVVEVKKNEGVWWSRSDRAARFEQRRYGRTPLAGIYVADFVLDNHIDGLLDTANANSLDYKITLGAADTLSVIHQTLEKPVS